MSISSSSNHPNSWQYLSTLSWIVFTQNEVKEDSRIRQIDGQELM